MKEIIPEVVADDPFKNCLFDREKYSNILTNLINNHETGFVLSINNSWGTGKTTFIEMFRQSLINEGFETALFNAWENDYETDPLISILGELKILSKAVSDKEKIDKVVTNGSKIAIKGFKAIVKHQIVKHAGQEFADIYDSIIESGQDIIEKEIDEYSEKKNNIVDFRKSLVDYISSRSNEKPIVFIIDELDRCRPDYGINFLESIKHFFNVPNIVFILSIDKEQLGAAIKGFYGSESIDTDEYLKKIIDIELSLPYPDLTSYTKAKIQSLVFENAKIITPQTTNNDIIYNIEKSFKIFYEQDRISPRKLNKILNHQKLVVLSFNEYEHFNFYIISFLMYLKYQHDYLYTGLLKKDEKIFNKVIEILVGKMTKTRLHHVELHILKSIYAFLVTYYESEVQVEHFKDISSKINNFTTIQLFLKELDQLIKSYSYQKNNIIEKNYYFDKIEFLSFN